PLPAQVERRKKNNDDDRRVAAESSYPTDPSLAVAEAAGHGDYTAPLMFTGIQVLSPRIFEYIPRNSFSHSTVHVYPTAIQAGEQVIGYVVDDDWYEMSTLDRYLEASLALLQKTSPTVSREQVVAGRGCVIQEGAEVRESVLWDRVLVEAGARVERSV